MKVSVFVTFSLLSPASLPTPTIPHDVPMVKPSTVSMPSPALPPTVPSSSASPSNLSDAHLEIPGLSLSEFQGIYDSCVTSDSYGPVIRLLGARMRSWEQVNNSFVEVCAVCLGSCRCRLSFVGLVVIEYRGDE